MSNALHAARQAFIQSEADEKIRRALRCKIRASEQVFEHGDRVYYKRSDQDRWLGPGKVVFQDGRVVFVRHGGTFVRVSPNRLIKAGNELAKDNAVREIDTDTKKSTESEEHDSQVIVEEVIMEDSNTKENRNDVAEMEKQSINIKRDDRIEYKLSDSDEYYTATIIGRAGKATGQYNTWFNVRNENGEEMSLDLNRVKEWRKIDEQVNIVLIPRYRHNEQECVLAKQEELQKLKDFETYEEVEDKGQNRISTTWVLSMKGEGVKARLVARGFEDEATFRKDSPTFGKSIMRIILAIAASKNWKGKTTDIKSAFLQGKVMDREVYLQPPKEAGLAEGRLWKLKRCLYGLNDAARQFFQSVVDSMIQLGCQQSRYDPALFFLKQNGDLVGMMASHIDDFLHAGTDEFDEMIMKKLRMRILPGKLEEGEFHYVGFKVKQNEAGILVDQSEYIEEIEINTLSPQRASQKHEPLIAT